METLLGVTRKELKLVVIEVEAIELARALGVTGATAVRIPTATAYIRAEAGSYGKIKFIFESN